MTRDKVIDLIVDNLMTNVSGERAVRLKLMLPGEKDGGGNCESSVREIVEYHISAYTRAMVEKAADRTMLMATLREALERIAANVATASMPRNYAYELEQAKRIARDALLCAKGGES